MELEGEALSENLGIPIIIVVTKSDYVYALEKDRGYTNDHFTYIHTTLRRICLKYGASLIYTSARDDINCELLLHYLQHRLYQKISFELKEQFSEKSGIFVPLGWDTSAKIELDFKEQNLTKDFDTPFEDIITPPKQINDITLEQVIEVDEDEVFLQRNYEKIQSISQVTPPKLFSLESTPGTTEPKETEVEDAPPETPPTSGTPPPTSTSPNPQVESKERDQEKSPYNDKSFEKTSMEKQVMEKFYRLLSSTQRSTSPKKKNMDIAAELLRIRNSTKSLDINQLRITNEKDTKKNDNNSNDSLENNNDLKEDDEENETIKELISLDENKKQKSYKYTI